MPRLRTESSHPYPGSPVQPAVSLVDQRYRPDT